MATTIQHAGRHVPLERIRVPENVRALDEAHVEALAGSISLQGMLVPLVVREHGDGLSWSPVFTASPPRDRSAWLRYRSSSATPTPRTPTARSRTSRHADVGMT